MEKDVQGIADRGAEIYGELRNKFDIPENKGKFLAIEVESGKTYLGNTSSEALESAKQEYPDRFFYVIKIGFNVSEILARIFAEK